MILAVDIGNANTKIAGFQGNKIISQFCVDNKSLLNQKAAFPLKSSFLNRIRYILIASVNPEMESVFCGYLDRKHKVKILRIGREISIKVPVLVENPQTIGIDRLLNTLAAFRRTRASTLVIDFGTAITVDVVSKEGGFQGGLILPGIRTSAYALNKQTALLPQVEIRRPGRIIGRNTEEAIKSGIYFGTVGSIIHIIREVRKVYGDLQYTVATGGDGRSFKKDIPEIDRYIPRLTLEGIRIAFKESLTANGKSQEPDAG